jgi:hypothetical protein
MTTFLPCGRLATRAHASCAVHLPSTVLVASVFCPTNPAAWPICHREGRGNCSNLGLALCLSSDNIFGRTIFVFLCSRRQAGDSGGDLEEHRGDSGSRGSTTLIGVSWIHAPTWFGFCFHFPHRTRIFSVSECEHRSRRQF